MGYEPESGVVTDGQGVSPRADKPRLLEDVRRKLRFKHYSLRAERVYVAWIRRFILANDERHPRELEAEAEKGRRVRSLRRSGRRSLSLPSASREKRRNWPRKSKLATALLWHAISRDSSRGATLMG